MSSPTEGPLARLGTEGYVVLEDVVAPDDCTRLLAEADAIVRAGGARIGASDFEGRRTTRVCNLVAKAETARALVAHPGILPLVTAALGEGCLLSSVTTVAVGPGEVAQAIHVDDQGIDLERPHPPLEVAAMVALTEFTGENGATRVLPGSHRWADAPDWTAGADEPDEGDLVPVEMGVGSVLVYDGGLWHGAGPNRSCAPRVGLGISYCRGWVRQHENPYLGIPRELVASFDPTLRQLCGWTIHNHVINHVDGREPADLL